MVVKICVAIHMHVHVSKKYRTKIINQTQEVKNVQEFFYTILQVFWNYIHTKKFLIKVNSQLIKRKKMQFKNMQNRK